MYETYSKCTRKAEEEEGLNVTLDDYCKSNPVEETKEDCVALIEKAGHLEVLNKFFETFFERPDHKKNALWLKGITSSGKSTICYYLADIFHSQLVEVKREHITAEAKRWRKVKT